MNVYCISILCVGLCAGGEVVWRNHYCCVQTLQWLLWIPSRFILIMHLYTRLSLVPRPIPCFQYCTLNSNAEILEDPGDRPIMIILSTLLSWLCNSRICTCVPLDSCIFMTQCQLLERFPEESGAKDPAARMIPFLPGRVDPKHHLV